MAIKKYIPYSVRNNSSETFGKVFDYIERVVGADFRVQPNKEGISILELNSKWIIQITEDLTTFSSPYGTGTIPTYIYIKHFESLTKDFLKLVTTPKDYGYKEKEIETRLR